MNLNNTKNILMIQKLKSYMNNSAPEPQLISINNYHTKYLTTLSNQVLIYYLKNSLSINLFKKIILIKNTNFLKDYFSILTKSNQNSVMQQQKILSMTGLEIQKNQNQKRAILNISSHSSQGLTLLKMLEYSEKVSKQQKESSKSI